MENITRAISIQQPFVELILQGKKKIEYRTVPTRIRERVFLYASKKQRTEPALWRKAGKSIGTLPVGLIVGSVEIVACKGAQRDYQYLLRNPKRLRKALLAKNQPCPVFWKPTF